MSIRGVLDAMLEDNAKEIQKYEQRIKEYSLPYQQYEYNYTNRLLSYVCGIL